MFWIFRRTGAVNFFNSINNNYAAKSTVNNNTITEKSNQRPPRKYYGRLSMESDDTQSITHTNNNLYDNRNEFVIIDEGNEKDPQNMQGNYEMDNHSDIDVDKIVNDEPLIHRFDRNTVCRQQSISLSDDDDYDESLTCNVCDRAFHCHRQLASHQQKKRHFGCSGCDSLFPSLMLLEHHKEEFEHWSDTEMDNRPPCCRRNRIDADDFSDAASITSEAESEDLERLL